MRKAHFLYISAILVLFICFPIEYVYGQINTVNKLDVTYSYQKDAWNIYKANFFSDEIIKIEHWSRSFAGDDTPFEFHNDVGLIKLNDSNNEFQWINNSNLAFTLLLQDSSNSDLKEPSLVLFSVEDQFDISESLHKSFVYQNSAWDIYKAYLLFDNIIKIEHWFRSFASDDKPFEFRNDLGLINIRSTDNDFEWVDGSHTSFILSIYDRRNDDLNNNTPVLFTTNGQSDISEEFYKTFLYQNSKWDLYKAFAITENKFKIEHWFRSIATDDKPFEFRNDLGIIRIDSTDIDFEWTDDSHTSFLFSLQDTRNDDLKEPSLVIFKVDSNSGSNIREFVAEKITEKILDVSQQFETLKTSESTSSDNNSENNEPLLPEFSEIPFVENTLIVPTNSVDEWDCPVCGNHATGKFCNNCGNSRPDEVFTPEPMPTIIPTLTPYIENSSDFVSDNYDNYGLETMDYYSLLELEAKVERAMYRLMLHEGIELPLGKYIIGEEIPEGRYIISATNDFSSPVIYIQLFDTSNNLLENYEIKPGKKISISLFSGMTLAVDSNHGYEIHANIKYE